MKYYKLTDENDVSYNHTKWGVGITHKALGCGTTLCSPDVIHVYDHPLKAVMFNPVHAKFPNYHLWEVKVKGIVNNDTLKVGVKQCTTIRQIDAPVITTEQRVKFNILCSLKVYKDKSFIEWANKWLDGTDRTEPAARSNADSVALSAALSAAWSATLSAAKPIDFVSLIRRAIS